MLLFEFISKVVCAHCSVFNSSRTTQPHCIFILRQNLFEQQSQEQSEKIFATSQSAVTETSTTEPTEKPHTLEEYSYDHFRCLLPL